MFRYSHRAWFLNWWCCTYAVFLLGHWIQGYTFGVPTQGGTTTFCARYFTLTVLLPEVIWRVSNLPERLTRKYSEHFINSLQPKKTRFYPLYHFWNDAAFVFLISFNKKPKERNKKLFKNTKRKPKNHQGSFLWTWTVLNGTLGAYHPWLRTCAITFATIKAHTNNPSEMYTFMKLHFHCNSYTDHSNWESFWATTLHIQINSKSA